MTTPLDALVAALHDAASYNPSAESMPEAVLWCDPNGEFTALLPALRERLPELLRTLIDLSDDVATKIQVLFYADAPDALRKALHD